MLSFDMEHLPVEVIGNIFSHLKAARDGVVTSATCKKWREAWRNHLHALSFNSNDWPVHPSTSTMEIIITQTILQTTGLENLTISMDETDEFSASPTIAWLMYTRDTLRRLFYNVKTTPSIDIIEKCGRKKLESLELANNSIRGIEPTYQKFPCLTSLSLSHISISAFDLGLLLTACPILEKLTLISPDILMLDAYSTMELSSPSLKDVFVESINLKRFTLEADILEVLHLRDCTFDIFELISNGTLRVVKIDYVGAIHLDIGDDNENLEIVDISNFTIVWLRFFWMIQKSSSLWKLRLWGVIFDDFAGDLDLDTFSVTFPQLTHLSLGYDIRRGDSLLNLQKSSQLKNVTMLELGVELGWNINDLFLEWVANLLERCPKLNKLKLLGVISEAKTPEGCQSLAHLTTSIVQLMRKYPCVQIQFDFE